MEATTGLAHASSEAQLAGCNQLAPGRRDGSYRLPSSRPLRSCRQLAPGLISASHWLPLEALMSGGANDRRRDTRHDCFISFPGSQKLRDLGFTWAGPDDTVRDLAREIFESLCAFHRNPGIFYDHAEIRGRFRNDLAHAVLQLRGGGVALVLLSGEYLRRKYCLAELRAFLELERLGAVAGREGEAASLRIVCLDAESTSIRDALGHPDLKRFVGDVGSIQCHPLGHGSTRALAVKEICDHVLRYWTDNRSMCLGKNQDVCLSYMQSFFSSTPAPLIANALGVRAPEGVQSSFLATLFFPISSIFGGAQTGLTREYAFSQAWQQGSLSDHNLLALLEATTNVDARAALLSFSRKWVSDGWSWSIEAAGENDVCLPRFIEETAGVLPVGQAENRRGETSSAITSATPIPVVDQTTIFPNGDVFRPHLPNRQHLSEGLEDSAATSLARLKSAVLPACPSDGSNDGSRSTSPASSSSLRHVALTSINGEGGVGKTSTCKLLCSDADVRNHFANGAILWIDVGQSAMEEAVVTELRKAVSRCGGKHTAEEIRSSSDIFEAADIACEFFSKRRILVIFDNVWETPAKSKVESWAVTLSKIASFPGSTVIMTTRFYFLSESSGFDRVDLGRLDLVTEGSTDWRIAEHLYDALLNATLAERLNGIYVTDRKKALKLSCGLPLAIKTLTGVVRSRLRFGDDVSAVLAKIESRAIGIADKYVGEDMSAATGHPGLFAAMEESLAFLDMHKGCRVKSTPLAVRKDVEGNNSRLFSASYAGLSDCPLSSRYAALEVMPLSSVRISLHVLCRLWHLRDVEEAEEIALLFVNIGLGRLEKCSLGQDRVLCLHDLQHEFCMRVASLGVTGDSGTASPSSPNGHALLLSSYESLLDPAKDVNDIGMQWAQLCFAEGRILSEVPLRKYLIRNLLRHLCGAADEVNGESVKRTMMSLLSDFGWLRGRIAVGGRSSAILDCTTALSSRSCTSAETRLLTGGAEKSIRALQQGLMLVGESVSLESDGTLAGALVQLCQSTVVSGDDGMDTVFFEKLAWSSESGVRGPWVKPVRGCSRSRDRGVLAQATVGGGGWVRSLVAFGDGEHFVSGSADGVVRVHECKRLIPVLELNGHTERVYCVCVSKAGGVEGSPFIFSGSNDSTVRAWKVGLDMVEGVVQEGSVVVGDCDSGVWCLAVSRGGDLVAAGCGSGEVYIWKRREGDADLSFEPVASFRCAVAGKDSGCVCGVAVSRSGDLVVAGEQGGGIVFWSSGGIGSEGTVDRYSASDESGADLRHVLLSEDEVSVSFVFNEPAGCEVWDASRRRRSPRVALPIFRALLCATLSAGWEACAEESGARGVIVAGGWDENIRFFTSLHSPSNNFKLLSTYSLTSTPRSVCCTSFGDSKRILVGSDDGCVRMLDASVSDARGAAEPYGGSARSLGSGRSEAPDAPELELVSTVAVMAAAGIVVSGHKDGQFSLWRAESGDFVRAFGDERGGGVACVYFDVDERLAVSGHGNGVALAWDASTWECRFALEGHSEPVVCATISADGKRIVTVDSDGELRLWRMRIGGAALQMIETGLEFSSFGSRGAISLDGGLFLWASRDRSDQKWRGKVIDFASDSVIWNWEEARHSDWDAFLKEMMSSEAFDGKKEALWRLGAVYGNRSVELPDADSGQQSADEWRVSSGGEHGGELPRIDCALRSAEEGGTISAAASLGFDSDVCSIAAEWMPREAGGRRRALVACWLDEKSRPAIMHFYPSN